MAQVPRSDVDVTSEKCTDHKRCVVYSCDTCNGEFICIDCPTTTHNGHKLGKIQDFLSKQVTAVLTVLNDTDKYIKRLGTDVANVTEKMSLNDVESEERIAEIEERGRQLKSLIDIIVKDGGKRVRRNQRKNNRILQKVLDKLTATKSKLEQKSHGCRELVNSNKYADTRRAVEYGSELESDIANTVGLASIKSQRFTCPDLAVDTNTRTLEELFGEMTIDKAQIAHVNLVLKSTFQNADDESVFRMCPVMEGEAAWIGGDDATLRLYTFNGELLQDVEFDSGIYDICNVVQSDSSNVLIVSCEDNTVRKFTPTGSSELLYSTSEFFADEESFQLELFRTKSEPRSLSITADNDIIIVSPGETLPLKYDLDGKQPVTVSKEKKAFQFTDPQTVRVNNDTGDIAVLNLEPGCLCVFDKNMKTKFTYCGGKNEENESEAMLQFDPQDITLDSENNIVVADVGSSSVYLLDNDGHYLQTLITNQGEPQAVEMLQECANNVLWVGYRNGKVETYCYNMS